MSAWTPCPESCLSLFAGDSLRTHWQRLHLGDSEPWPTNSALQDGWRLYHEGDFGTAADLGLSLGVDGLALACKATCMHATYVEPRDSVRFPRLQTVTQWTGRRLEAAPDDPTAWYWQGYALGRYSQGISVSRALAMGLGRRVREALENAHRIAPTHVDAHLALARFHAETIDQVGELIGGMLHGARRDQGEALYDAALALAPQSLIVLNEAAEGLLMLGGDAAQPRVAALQSQARALEPLDAMEKLYLQAAAAS